MDQHDIHLIHYLISAEGYNWQNRTCLSK